MCIKTLLNLTSSLGNTSLKSKLRVLASVFFDLFGAFGASLLTLMGFLLVVFLLAFSVVFLVVLLIFWVVAVLVHLRILHEHLDLY